MLVDDEIVAYSTSACNQGKSVTFCTVGASFHHKSSYICPPQQQKVVEHSQMLPCNRQSSGCLILRWNITHPYPGKSNRLFSLSLTFFSDSVFCFSLTRHNLRTHCACLGQASGSILGQVLIVELLTIIKRKELFGGI